jgi:hypothetical protein
MPDSESELDESEPTASAPKRKRSPNKNPRYTKPRGRLNSKEGISYVKPQPMTGNPGCWLILYRGFRKSGITIKAEAEATSQKWKDENLCPCCEQAWPLRVIFVRLLFPHARGF